jgi:hypothetical protein
MQLHTAKGDTQMPNSIEIITRFERACRASDQATIDELCDPGPVDHNPAPDHEPTLTGFKHKVADFNSIFPDLEEDLEDMQKLDAIPTWPSGQLPGTARGCSPEHRSAPDTRRPVDD